MRLGLCRAKKWIDLFNNKDKKNIKKNMDYSRKKRWRIHYKSKRKGTPTHTGPKPTKIDVELTWE